MFSRFDDGIKKKNQSIEQGLRLKKTAFQVNFGRK